METAYTLFKRDDILYVDYIEIRGGTVYGITSVAGDNKVKAVVELEDGDVTVWAWYIK